MALEITNYDELLAVSADWLNRGDLDNQLPVYIRLAEAQFNREVRVRDMLLRSTATSDREMVALPPDYLEHYSLVVAPGGSPTLPPLRYMSERETNEIKAASPASGQVAGYTLVGNAFELVPAPAGNVELKLVYYTRIPNLSATQPTNWLLDKSPDLYLYSTLLQAEPYLKNDERLSTWIQFRSAILETMRMESEAAMRPRAGLVARPRPF